MIKINDFNIHIYYIEYETSNGVKTLHIIFNNIEGYLEDNCGSKYLISVPVDENKGDKKYKKYGIKLSILMSQKILVQVIMMINK